MIHSIRRFLFVSLIIAITVASSITAIGNYLLDKQIIKPYLDEQLIDNYIFIKKLNAFARLDATTKKIITPYLTNTNTPNLMYQIWRSDGKLILHSFNNTTASLENTPTGFSDARIQNNDWRVYAGIDETTGAKIVVAQQAEVRNKLTDLIARNNSYVTLITYPIFAILIWLIIGVALRSMTRLSNQISNRATHLEPINLDKIPIEIKPLVDELNYLLERLKQTFERNKRFVADTAHELRTPLAALKTQAQVALKTNDEASHQHALIKIVQSVDRCSHVVTQLLTLSSLRGEENLNDMHPLHLHPLATEILTYLAPLALEKNIDIELASPPAQDMIMGNNITLGILIRNLVDNAIRYTPHKGAVTISIINENGSIILRVTDTGSGIPAELHERVFDRFYRILGTSQTGSGLGLAIVKQIAELHHADIRLNTPANGIGLQIDVIFPKISLTQSYEKQKNSRNHQ